MASNKVFSGFGKDKLSTTKYLLTFRSNILTKWIYYCTKWN